MAWIAVAVVGSTVVSSALSADAAGDAADAQADAAAKGEAGVQARFDEVRKLLSPYVESGNKALSGQMDLLGLNGSDAQKSAIGAIQASPMFTSLQQQGNDAIMANASATGGLRGGNMQAALAQFSPQLLAQLIQQQYGNLGGISSMGQNAAAGVGNAGMSAANTSAQLQQQAGAALAGGALAQGRAWAAIPNAVTGILGGMGGFGGKF